MTDIANPQDKLPDTDSGATNMPTSSALGMVVDGRYRIVQPLAAGGMGSVYLGMQENLSRRVAIKRVNQPGEEDSTRFRREAEALAAVSHPAIVEVHDYVSEPDAGVSYLIMAYVDGENLDDYVTTRPGEVLRPLEALDLMVPVASALVELHSHEILHRDIKPANLVRYERADGRAAVKLVDFGIARRAQDPGLTAEGLIVGTPPYLGPEVILGKGHSEASDVYAYGATLFELLTGDAPHGKEDLHHILKHATQDDVILPADLNTTPLGTLLLRALNREDEGRPTMQEMLDELEQIRLTLLMDSDDPDAALHATRNISGGTLPPGFAPSPLSRDSATALLNPNAPMPSGAVPTGTAPPGSTALMSQREAAQNTHNITRLRATPNTGPSKAARIIPWIVAGVAGVVANVVTVILLVSDPQPKPASTKPPGDPNQLATMDEPDEPDEPMRHSILSRPAPMNTSLSGAAVAKVTGELLAGCTSQAKATSLFYRANRRRYKTEHRAWCKAAFSAVLKCKHSIGGQKMWASYRLAQLHAKDNDCGGVAKAWRLWMRHGGLRKMPHLKKPKCSSSS